MSPQDNYQFPNKEMIKTEFIIIYHVTLLYNHDIFRFLRSIHNIIGKIANDKNFSDESLEQFSKKNKTPEFSTKYLKYFCYQNFGLVSSMGLDSYGLLVALR